MLPVSLSLTARHHALLRSHLFPDDGCEAVAILLCGRAKSSSRDRLLCRRVEPIPYSACSVRLPDRVTWPTETLLPLLDDASKNGWAVVKVHGHRGFDRFSWVDDEADRALFPGIYAWAETAPHGSCIAMDDGRVFGRVVDEDGAFHPFERVAIVGDDIVHWPGDAAMAEVPDHGRRVAQTFGIGTYARLSKLRAAVIGCSGTGSPVIEQLARNSIGSLVLIDPDRVERKNLNRILNSTMEDAVEQRLKVDVAKRAIEAMGMGTRVETYPLSLFHRDVIRAVASCDVIFGCVDTIDARHLLNKLATFYLIPYFDLGVKIEADGAGGVDQVCGSIHYLRPDGSSLLSRHTFSLEQVRAAGLQRVDPVQYRQQIDAGYIRGAQEERPAVIQLNSLIASYAVNEFLARIHPYRLDANSEYAITRISLTHGIYEHEREGEPCAVLARHAGRGDVEPPVEWAELSER